MEETSQQPTQEYQLPNLEKLYDIFKNNVHKDVKSEGLQEHHGKPSKRRSVNLSFELVFLSTDKSHVRTIYVSSINRYDHIIRGLHFNSIGKGSFHGLLTRKL
jgi:hypothetical protein